MYSHYAEYPESGEIKGQLKQMPERGRTLAGITSFLVGYFVAYSFFLEWLLLKLGAGGSDDPLREFIGDILYQLICFVPQAIGLALVLVAMVARSGRFKAWPPLVQLFNLCVVCLLCGIVAYFPLQLYMLILYTF